jgi:hypothetical protein
MTVRMHRDEQTASLERKANAATGRRRSGRGAKAERFALELEQLFGVDLSAELLDAFEYAALRRGELVDLFCELVRIPEDLPSWLQRECDRRRRWSSEVVASDRTHGFERSLREECSDAPGIFALPRTELHEIRGRKDELDLVFLRRAREQNAPLGEWLKCGRHGRNDQNSARLRDPVEQLDARRRQAARLPQFGERDERSGDLCGRIEALGGIDADAETRHERVELRAR